MKIRSIEDVEEFTRIVNTCKGPVWLESVYGDKYNLKSALTQYVAIAKMVEDNADQLELYATLREDEAKLLKFAGELEDKYA